jgi:neutral ceramidase
MTDTTLQIGFGRRDITPALGTFLTGYGDDERPAEEILDPLHATAMVISQAGTTAAVIGLDWCFICEQYTEMIRQAIVQKTPFRPENIQLSCSHTHSGPHTRLRKTIGGGVSHIENGRAYVLSVLPQIVGAVQDAVAALTECTAGFAQCKSLTGVSRRGIFADGQPSFKAGPDDAFDPYMTVARFRNAADGKTLGILVHYGAHSTAMGKTRQVSRDWCGVMKDRIESQFQAPVLFLNGSEGDVGPRTNCVTPEGHLRAGGGDGVESVREVGYRAATDAIGALLSIKDFRARLPLAVKTFDLTLPYQPLLPQTEAEKLLDHASPQQKEYARMVLQAWQEPLQSSLSFRQTLLAIGPLAIVPLPGGVFSSISLRTRAASPYQYTLVCCQSNGTGAYLVDREAVARGGYEVATRIYFGPYIFVDDIDDKIVADCHTFLEELFAQTTAG